MSSVHDIELKDNGQEAKTAPIVILARTTKKVPYRFSYDDEAIEILHDFTGMQHKDRISIDWGHSGWNMIGYVNKFNFTPEGLVLGGAIIPYEASDDKASELIYKYKQGVPYEASITFDADAEGMEWLPEGAVTVVNGEEVEGPVLIYRKWNLSAVAVCQLGADSETNIIMSQNRKGKKGLNEEMLQIDITDKVNGEITMIKENVEAKDNEAVDTEETVEATKDSPVELSAEDTAQEVEAVEAVEAVENEPETVEAVAEEAVAEVEGEKEAEPEDVESEVEDSIEEGVEAEEEEQVVEKVAMSGESYMNLFGETKGAIYFAKGMKIEEAYKAHIEFLSTELEEAKAEALEGKVQMTRGNDAVELSRTPKEEGMSIEDFIRSNIKR